MEERSADIKPGEKIGSWPVGSLVPENTSQDLGQVLILSFS